MLRDQKDNVVWYVLSNHTESWVSLSARKIPPKSGLGLGKTGLEAKSPSLPPYRQASPLVGGHSLLGGFSMGRSWGAVRPLCYDGINLPRSRSCSLSLLLACRSATRATSLTALGRSVILRWAKSGLSRPMSRLGPLPMLTKPSGAPPQTSLRNRYEIPRYGLDSGHD